MSRASLALHLLVFPAILVACGRVPAFAETLRYQFEVPDREAAEFEVAFDVVHPGRINAEISWAGPRILSFRIAGPGTPPIRQSRAGPSPQRLQPMVTESTVSAGHQWTLTIRALPARGKAIADLVVETPEPAPIVSELAPRAEAPAPSAGEPQPPWAMHRTAPPTAGEAQRLLFESIEALRAMVVLPGGDLRPDACSWQSGFLEYAVRVRDGEVTAPGPPELASRACAHRLAGSIRRIESLRTSQDPEVLAPPPDDPDLRIAWKARRGAKIGPVEQDLDELFELLHSGRCPEFAAESWPTRLLACATSCERHFEEQLRTGRDDAANGDVARDQWPLVQAAAAALEAIAGPEPAREPAPLP